MASDTEIIRAPEIPDDEPSRPTPRGRPRWQVVVAAAAGLIIAYGIGNAAASSAGNARLVAANADAERRVTAAEESTTSQLAAAEERAAEAEAEMTEQNNQIAAERFSLEQDQEALQRDASRVEARDNALDKREAKLDKREAQLDDRAAALGKLERKAEKSAAMTQIDEGVYEVGVDMEPGVYKSSGGGACYWARMSHSGDNIIDNHFGPGPAVATVQSGELFETQGCGTFIKQ